MSVTIVYSGGGGDTDLGYTPSPTGGTVTSSTGADSTLPLADATNAGLASPQMFNAISGSTPTNPRLGLANTYFDVVDPLNGILGFVIDGVQVGSVQMVNGNPKWTFTGIVDPEVYAGTPITTIERNAYTAAKGYLVFNEDTNVYQFYNGTTWIDWGSGGGLTAQASNTLLGNNTAGSALPTALTATQVKTLLEITPNDLELAALTLTNADVVAGDTLQVAVGKLQAQIDNASVITPSSQAEVTAGTAAANEYVQPDTLKVELDKKISSTLADGKVLVGNATNVATEVNLSGDVTITNAGVATVVAATSTVAGKVELSTPTEVETGTSTTTAITPEGGEATYVKKSIVNAKGDLIVGTADNTVTRLAVGADGLPLVSDSTTPTGLAFKVLNVVRKISAAEVDIIPGVYELSSTGGAFDITLADKIGSWTFLNSDRSLNTNAVTLKSTGTQTYTNNVGTQVDADYILNVGNKEINITHTELGDTYRVSTADSVSVPPLFTPNGAWNATTNTPDLTVATNRVSGSQHFVYYISNTGTQNLGLGNVLFEAGGRIEWYNATTYAYIAPTANTTVEDSLTSTSPTTALSAKQGKILNDNKVDKATYTAKGSIIVADGAGNPVDFPIATGDVEFVPNPTTATGVEWKLKDRTTVKIKALGATPEVGFLNLYPNGQDVTLLPLPTHVAGRSYSVAALNAAGTTYETVTSLSSNGTAWVQEQTVQTGNVRFGIADPIAEPNDIMNDTYIQTNDGTETGAVISVWKYEGTAWINTTIALPSNVRFGSAVPIFVTGDAENDTYIRTSDGTATGSIVSVYKYSGTAWIEVTIPTTVRFGSAAPTVIATDRMNDTYLRTSDGTSTGTLVSIWKYTGTAWVTTSGVTTQGTQRVITGTTNSIGFDQFRATYVVSGLAAGSRIATLTINGVANTANIINREQGLIWLEPNGANITVTYTSEVYQRQVTSSVNINGIAGATGIIIPSLNSQPTELYLTVPSGQVLSTLPNPANGTIQRFTPNGTVVLVPNNGGNIVLAPTFVSASAVKHLTAISGATGTVNVNTNIPITSVSTSNVITMTGGVINLPANGIYDLRGTADYDGSQGAGFANFQFWNGSALIGEFGQNCQGNSSGDWEATATVTVGATPATITLRNINFSRNYSSGRIKVFEIR